MTKPKIITTGGAGYIGSHTAVALQEAGFEVVLMDNLVNSSADVIHRIGRITGKEPLLELVDLCDEQATKNCFSKHSDAVGIIHFAALKAVGESVAQPTRYYRNNLVSMLHVLEAMHQHNIPNLIFSSSATVYGQPDVLPVTEQTPLQPAASPYGQTKQMNEVMIRDAVFAGELKRAISLRYFNPVGAHPTAIIGELPLGIPNNLMPFITQTAIGIRKELAVFGGDYDTIDGTAVRDYIHVMDLAEAHLGALQYQLNGSQSESYDVINLGTGLGSTVLEVIQSFEKVTGINLNYRIVDRRPGDVAAIYANVDKAARVLHWHTQRDLDEMTRSAWAWEKYARETLGL
ncbi:MAG: UDP-glucose 4-epimerase GalE [Lewinellaceae bacterium]|nr:UDP-glucose 4-epimerase GalE [Saprospiraceae bacterium]MCB9271499.1 UDP-glucose 4-epimerase GalE [Lewinellaceae bacterium]HPG08378.1 UDP-glucose 4-epimerase GalE [Saprospiraceae bacterium]